MLEALEFQGNLSSANSRSSIEIPTVQIVQANGCIHKNTISVPSQDKMDLFKQTLRSMLEARDLMQILVERPDVSQKEKDTFTPIIRDVDTAIKVLSVDLACSYQIKAGVDSGSKLGGRIGL